MSNNHDVTEELVLDVVRSEKTMRLEQLLGALPQLTWNQIFQCVDRLSRRGDIILLRRGFDYEIASVPQKTSTRILLSMTTRGGLFTLEPSLVPAGCSDYSIIFHGGIPIADSRQHVDRAGIRILQGGSQSGHKRFQLTLPHRLALFSDQAEQFFDGHDLVRSGNQGSEKIILVP